jgi:branched-chain amino acid transport system substrate-binding protein
VINGGLVVGNASLYAATGSQKPVFGGVGLSPVDFAAKDAYFYTSGPITGTLGEAYYVIHTLKAKTVALINPTEPGAEASSAALKKALTAAGVKVKQVQFPPTSTDLTGPLVASGAQTADALIPTTSGPGCIAIAQAITQLAIKTPVVSGGLCADPAVAKPTGFLPPWTFIVLSPNTFQPEANPQVAIYRTELAKYAGASEEFAGVAPQDFAAVLTAVKFMNELGPTKITSATMRQKIKSFTGPMFLGPPNIKCGLDKMPALCSDQIRAYTANGKGGWTDDYAGKWSTVNLG